MSDFYDDIQYAKENLNDLEMEIQDISERIGDLSKDLLKPLKTVDSVYNLLEQLRAVIYTQEHDIEALKR